MPWKDKSKYKTERYKGLQAKWSNDWYHRNKQHVITNNVQRKKEIREWYYQLRQGLFCVDCGQTHPATLHFHHRDPAEKEFSVATAVINGKNIEAIEKEIKKCIVLCANCHTIRHYEYNRGNLQDLGVAGQFEQIETELQIKEEEVSIHHMYFNSDSE